jgi:sulfite dehydrogenase (cytochrome) subunit A
MTDLSRRRFVQRAISAALAASSLKAIAAQAPTVDTNEGITFAAGPRPLVRFPQKRELILVTSRPPHLETPFEAFDGNVLTPNDAFYVRYHLAGLPTSIDPATYRLSVTGTVKTPLSLSLDDLKKLPGQTEVVAVNQCSGNGRGYFAPRIFGAQLGKGAMGNARWTGVSLKSVLERAGVAAGAVQVAFNGLDQPVLPSTPDFRKALDIEHALSDGPLLAWSMNGQDLPFLNGYPLKLIVPGYFGTYWVKHLSDIEVLDKPFSGHDAYFQTTGYRIPDNACACVTPGTVPDKLVPINSLPVRSFITSVTANERLSSGKPTELRGIAFDGGAGIKAVDVSIDSGKTWRATTLGDDLGRYSFRPWQLSVTFPAAGNTVLMVRAANNSGEVQPAQATWNPSGYRRHVIESTPVTVV